MSKIPTADLARFMLAHRRLCPTYDSEARVRDFARVLRWSIARTCLVVEELVFLGRIETDAGCGFLVTAETVVEGR